MYGQNAVLTAGGDYSGTTGSVSFSVGQVGYNAYSGNILFSEGVQQPYEIYDITDIFANDVIERNGGSLLGIDDEKPEISLSAYPNPTDDFLTLLIESNALGEMKCTVYDVSGRQISERNIFAGETRLDMSGLPPATYFVRVTDNGRILKTFKIVKN